MAYAAAWSILALTVGLSLARPRVGRVRILPQWAALLGACLTIAAGILTPTAALQALRALAQPLLTILSLMTITIVAERVGIFRLVAWHLARAGGGDARRLLTLLFVTGTLAGVLFTNDAAVLVFTPLVLRLVEQIRADSWSDEDGMPFYFAVLCVANLVAPLVIGNPINIVVASCLSIGFFDYALWMTLPALVSMLVTYTALRIAFRGRIPATYRMPVASQPPTAGRCFLGLGGVVLGLTLAGFFAESVLPVPLAFLAAAGALILLVAARVMERVPVAHVGRGIGWDVLIFVSGIFLVAKGLSAAGLTASLGDLLWGSARDAGGHGIFVTSLSAGICSSVMNNHPVAQIMAMVIQDLAAGPFEERVLAFAALIGGDLGPKMLPLGSLAALMWFRILRSAGVEVSYMRYIRIGVPMTLAAIVLASAVLWLEALFVLGLR